MLVIGIFILIQQNSHQLIDYIRNNYEIEVFFKENVSDLEAKNIVKDIEKFDGIESVTLVTKDEALKIYEAEFDEDLIEVLGYNPLPTSAVLILDKKGNTEVDVAPLISELEKIQYVDDVVFEGTLITRVEDFYKTTVRIISYIALGLLIIAVIVISNTVKLSVYAKQDLIKNLRSIGATKLFVKTPFIIEGIIEGVIGAVLAILVLFGLVKSAQTYYSDFLSFDISLAF